MNVHIIKADGTQAYVQIQVTSAMIGICGLIGANKLVVVDLGGSTMFIDGDGLLNGKQANHKATRIYQQRLCDPTIEYIPPILGDVAIIREIEPKVPVTERPAERCESCLFFLSPMYECRRHAPIARPRTDIPGDYDHAFPRVQPSDWCGDYEKAP